MQTLVLQSFGREGEYRRAILTTLSYFAWNSGPVAETAVLLFTDRPEYFEPYFSGLPVSYVLLTPEKIKVMRGGIDFLHRMKIALIEEAYQRCEESKLLYADSDTFFTADPTPLADQLTPDHCFMHLREFQFEENKDLPLPAGATYQAFYRVITTRQFKGAQGQSIDVRPDMYSWNAGVMFFHPSHARVIPDVYALTNQFFPDSQNHASEQFAFSIMLQTTTRISPCESVIYHYWYRTKKQIADHFLNRELTSLLKLKSEERFAMVRQWTKKLPVLFEEHEFALRDNAVQAFNGNRFGEGYRWTLKAITKAPSDKVFLKDVLHHTKRWMAAKNKS